MTAAGRTVDRSDRGEWALVAALVIAGAGLAAGSQVLVVAATLPLWYVAAAVLGSRQPTMIRLQRELVVNGESSLEAGDDARADAEPIAGDPGDTVSVRTTVQNAGSETVVDLRVVDGVPEALPVVSGTPRACVTLEPLEATTLEYEVALRRGEHAFDAATVRTRDLTGTVAETWTAEVAGESALRCAPPVETVPLSGGTNDYAGEVPTDEGGSGVEFYSVREYEPGDPVGSIDWRRYARTRDLATVEYRAERATRLVCVVDARSSQFGAATTGDVPAVDRSADAAERTVDALVAAGHPTGAVGFYERYLATVPPGTDHETRARVRRLLAAVREGERGVRHELPAAVRTRSRDPVADLLASLPGEAQVYLFSSFVDDAPLDLVERLRVRGYTVRVVSPDVTAADDVPTRLRALERDTRLARVRALGAHAVDWDRDRPLGPVLREAIGEVRRR